MYSGYIVQHYVSSSLRVKTIVSFYSFYIDYANVEGLFAIQSFILRRICPKLKWIWQWKMPERQMLHWYWGRVWMYNLLPRYPTKPWKTPTGRYANRIGEWKNNIFLSVYYLHLLYLIYLLSSFQFFIVNLQRTPYDSKASLKVYAKTDEFMALLLKELNMDHSVDTKYDHLEYIIGLELAEKRKEQV